MIEDYLKNRKLGIKITFSIENKPLGTGVQSNCCPLNNYRQEYT